MTDLPNLLLLDWNIYMMQTRVTHQRQAAGLFVGSRKPTVANVALLTTMVGWCQERMIEPRQWLFFLFKRTGWKFPPRFLPNYLMSDKAIPKYRSMSGLAFFRKRVGASILAEQGSATHFDPNRDITSSVEHLKMRYADANQPDRCLDESLLRTLGFHPKSKVCTTCALRADCATQLEAAMRFPIIALRAGRLTTEAAEGMSRGC